MEAPIPQPRLDDDEDVHWALSTAVALWGRSEHTEALKWLRRAAEQASDVNADKRALELFKAAAEVANMVGKGASMPPPPAQQTPTPAPAEAAAPVPTGPRPPPVPPPRHRPGPPPIPSTPPPSVRPPSMPAPPPATPVASAAIPAAPRPPAAPARSVPPPVTPAPQKAQAPAPGRPSMPSIPQIAAPTRPVAISAAKPMPQAVAPKRRRSFSGEARPVEKARSSEAARPAHKRRKTHTGDELHLPAKQPDPENIWDDLDEDTRVISARERPRDEIDQALARLRAAPAPPPPAEPAKAQDSTPAASSTNPGAADWQPNDTVSPIQAAAAERAPAAAQAPPRRLDTLPSLRVAVLATGIAGEVRLISLDAAEAPPPGAALAVLVPLSAADGDAITRLFRTID